MRPAPAVLAATATLLVLAGRCGVAEGAALASASGSDQPAGKNCVIAEQAGAHAAGSDGGAQAAPPTFAHDFYVRNFTVTASLDGLDGKQLPIAIDEVCDVRKALQQQAVQLAGGDGVALLSTRTTVWLDGQRVLGQAATTAVDGADTATMKVRLAPQRVWSEDEDGNKVPTFRTRRITITD